MAADKRVLYIEDEKFFADTVDKMFTAAGYTVQLASDGTEGIKIVREWKPDIVLLDLLLPKTDGYEVLKQLKADLGTKAIPVIVLSNLGSEDDVKKATEMGALHFFVKAMTMPTTILGTVKEVIGLPPTIEIQTK